MRDRPARQGTGRRRRGRPGPGASWCGPGPGRGECACGPQAAARPGARPGPGKRPPGRVPGCSLAGNWPGPGHWGRVCCGPARRRGLPELADDVMVVALAEDTRLVRLTVDDVIDHDGQVVIRLVPPIPVPEPFAAILTELAANRANMNTAANPRAWGCSPTDAPASPRPWHVRPAVPRARRHGHPDPRRGVPPARIGRPGPVVARTLDYRPGTATCTSSAPTEPGTATGHPRRELSAARRRPGSTLGPVPYHGAPGTTDRKDFADETAHVIT